MNDATDWRVDVVRRVPLGLELKRRFKSQGRPMSRVAQELGLSVNSLRSWVRRNVFPSEELERLADAAGLPSNEERLRDFCTFDIARSKTTYVRKLNQIIAGPSPDPDGVVAAIHSHWDMFRRESPSSVTELQALFKMLGAGSFCVCTYFDRLPYEWTAVGWTALGSHLVQAVAAGTTLIYLHPPETRGGEYVPAEAKVIEAFESFCARVTRAAGKGMAERVLRLACENIAFFVPGHHYRLYKISSHIARFHLYLQLWQGPSGGESMVIPLSEDAADAFLTMARNALQVEHPQVAAALGES